MTETKLPCTIAFSPITAGDKALFDAYLACEEERGCEFSFANLYLWGEQNFAEIHGHLVLFSHFGKRTVYPFPLGAGEKKEVLDAIIGDACARGIRCLITGVSPQAKETIERLYPGGFRFTADEGTFDYVYGIDDLADLPGKKYHNKRNHLARFAEAYPDAIVEVITEENQPLAARMLEEWYAEREEEDPHADFALEKAAAQKALREREALSMEGMILRDGDSVLAVTLGSRMSADTFDVQFEKARRGVQGAYAAINRAFARHIREKYPSVRYLDREEDMGIEGLRQAKRSYHPLYRLEKFRAEYAEGEDAD